MNRLPSILFCFVGLFTGSAVKRAKLLKGTSYESHPLDTVSALWFHVPNLSIYRAPDMRFVKMAYLANCFKLDLSWPRSLPMLEGGCGGLAGR
ncbi:unnamed protein product [Protopolystoma xenopodis]|uniref:Secreted protein n=1 Tax=Protopolystoma xenopodis TaxID=117903 RepID=A0A3S5CUL8_9PLAT|nr:unnamed protein product [Protopolystoma xenopodis]